jgi:hypothetical protein
MRFEEDSMNQTYDSNILNSSFPSSFQTVEDIRQKYLRRLTYDKVWLTPVEKPKSH